MIVGRRLSADAAESLAQWFGGNLNLNGITYLSKDEAQALAQWKNGELHLNGVSHLSADEAEALAQRNGGDLYLDGITHLSTDEAKALAQWKGTGSNLALHLSGITQLNAAISSSVGSCSNITIRLPNARASGSCLSGMLLMAMIEPLNSNRTSLSLLLYVMVRGWPGVLALLPVPCLSETARFTTRRRWRVN